MKQREIKFRGMDIAGRWFIGLLSISQGRIGQPPAGCYISNSAGQPWAYQVRPETIGQFTGLNDKNGVEIYEGDIIDSGGKRGSDASAILYQLKWGDESGGWDVSQIGPFCLTDGIDLRKVEVIRNIHENPELLPTNTTEG